MLIASTLMMGNSLPNDNVVGKSSSSSLSKYNTSIIQPVGWKIKTADIEIRIDDVAGSGFSKVEFKIDNGRFEDITDAILTDEKAMIQIANNAAVTVSITDMGGKNHTKSKYIECFDRENPTIKTGISGELLRIEANDELSGIAGVFVNGYEFTDLNNNILDIRLRDYAGSYSEIGIQAIDGAGNKSKLTLIKNPFYNVPSSSSSSAPPPPPSSSSSSIASSIVSSVPPVTPPQIYSQPSYSQPVIAVPTPTPTPPIIDTTTNIAPSPTDGTGTVIDNVVSNQREFFTIETPDGAIFYLVIDRNKTDNNVYLLNTVTQADLSGLASGLSQNQVSEKPEKPSMNQQEPDVPIVAPVEQVKKENPTGNFILILLIMAGAVGVGYYVKIYKPKQALAYEEEEEYEFEDDEEYVSDENEITEDTQEIEEDEVVKLGSDQEYSDDEDLY